MDALTTTIADWLVNDPHRAADLIVLMCVILGTWVLWTLFAIPSLSSQINRLYRQLRERGINVWEWK